jgi:CBS domain-containing protein
VTAARVQAADRDALIGNLQAPFLFLHQPLSTLSLSTATCKLDASIEQTARAMTEHGASAALITSESAAAVGIVTDRDLRARALADSLDASAAIHTIMSAPLQRIAEQAPVYEALARMGQHGVRHLAVEDADGRIVGVVDDAAVHEFAHGSPVALLSAIAGARSPEQVALLCKRGAAHAAALSSGGAPAHQAMRMRTSLCDAAVQLLIHLAEGELGSPPCGFAFIAMGSHGREELTLASDQDNGIVYAPPDGADPETCQDYFLRLGARVCEGLSRAGFPVCRGGVMAENPRWCRSLPDWLSSFDAWVRAAEPQEIADFSISLDFRAVHGDAALAHNMRRRIHAAIADEPAFLIPFAHNALSFKPPFRLLGDIYLGGDAEHAGEIDLKDATMPLVSFARLYALRHQLSESNTRARIAALASAGHLSSASRDETMIAYDFLMQLRLRTQVAALQAGKPPHNSIDPGKLGRFERECLKQAFAQVGALQKKVSYDFAGAA